MQTKKLTLLFLFTGYFLMAQSKYNLIVGTYTNACQSNGIYVYEIDITTGNYSLKNSTEKIENPSYLSLSADKKKLYSVNESGEKSRVTTFDFNSLSGRMSSQGSQSASGADPCHLINDDTHVIVANYSGGNIAVFEKGNDGVLSEAKQVVTHYGKGINAKRQESPHVHMVGFSPDKKYVLASDLGNDKIYMYRYEPQSKEHPLVLKDTINVKKGSGPRHFTFSPNGKQVYLLQELDGTLTVFDYATDTLTKIQETSVALPDFKGETSAAAIQIAPDGQFLYATNRGTANTISIFKIQNDGKLVFVAQTPTLGKGPRDFAIDPFGNLLLVAQHYTNEIIIFKRDQKTGLLTATGQKINLCAPVCLVFSTL